MRTRSEAVEYFKRHGFHAAERSWALGDTIVVAAHPTQRGEITVYGRALYLVPRGHCWAIFEADQQAAECGAELPLDDACARVVEILSAPLDGDVAERAPDVVALVEFLRERFGDRVLVQDHRRGDRLATGLCRSDRPGRLAYVSLPPGEPSRFHVALESPPPGGSEALYQDAGEYRHLSMAEAVEVVARHLDLE